MALMQTIISYVVVATIAGGVFWWLNRVVGPRVRVRQAYLREHPEALQLPQRSLEGYVEGRRPTLTRAVLAGPVIAFFWRKKTRNRIKLG